MPAGTITLSTASGISRGYLGGGSNLWTYNPGDSTNWGDPALGYAPYPNGVNDRAWFNEGATGASGNDVVLDTSVTVNSMLFNAGSRFTGYSISKTGVGGTETIKLSCAGSTISAETLIQVLGGTNSIAPDIIMDSTPTIYLAAGSQLALTGALLQSGTVGLNITGGGRVEPAARAATTPARCRSRVPS